MKIEGIRELRKSLRVKTEKMPQAVSRALNRTGQGVVTEATRKVREMYSIKAQEVKAAMRITLSSPQAGEVEVTAKGGSLPLTRFKVTPRQPTPGRRSRPVKAAVRLGQSKTVSRAFVARLGSGHVGVYKRKFPGVTRARPKNAKGDRPELPIEELHAPAVPVMLGSREVVQHVIEETERRMTDRLDHEIGRIMGR
ncbi:hypothetical protein YDYSY3_57850 [Paenibacillus chitinolyticus]|uniref:phage tail protein n=1 Tax=Paenibacillus chitinolyticus TaxID=79263 RepID=UPI0026E49A90|nr:phage tail protein [Paenibacillus chitinolyticus]GKS14785.1 hypothetical protein YDYSY3_57850 [Paenibacillus chitinolyticus]